MSDPSKLSQQELVDYLVQAVEEEDVLFCVLWLQEMARRGMVCSREGELKADGINLERASLPLYPTVRFGRRVMR